jgi:hypothetical protein
MSVSMLLDQCCDNYPSRYLVFTNFNGVGWRMKNVVKTQVNVLKALVISVSLIMTL